MSEATGPQLRIGDAERESAVTALGEHYAAGRLTKEEYDGRSDRAYAARTASDLRPVFADLPGPQSGRPTPGSSDRPGGPSRPSQPGWSGPVGRPGWAPRSRRWWPAVVPVLVVLGVLTVLAHLPFLLLLLVGWLVWSGALRGRHGGYRRYRYDDTRRW